MKKTLSMVGAAVFAGAVTFAGVQTAEAIDPLIATRSPFQWPNFLGTVTDGGVAVADANAVTDLAKSDLSTIYQGGGLDYNVDTFQIDCLGPEPPIKSASNLVTGYSERQECPGWFFGNALLSASFVLSTP